MSYITGSVTDANPGPALHALMAPALTEAGFTLVDTVTISTRTHKVWESAAANNTQGLDWYLDIGYTTTGAGTIALIAFEMFDPDTDRGYRGPYCSSNTTVDAATGSRYGATGYALETNWSPNASAPQIQSTLTTAAFGYWISVTADRVILLASGTPTNMMYAGFYTPDPIYAAKAGAALFPLYSGVVGGASSSTSGALTRIAPATVTSPGWQGTVATGTSGGTYPLIPTSPTSTYPFAATPVAVMSGSSAHGRWGWLRDVFVLSSNGVVRGDTCTIDGSSHVLSSTSSAVSYAFKGV